MTLNLDKTLPDIVSLKPIQNQNQLTNKVFPNHFSIDLTMHKTLPDIVEVSLHPPISDRNYHGRHF